MAGARKTDLMADFVPELLKGGGRVAPFYLTNGWYDVGTVSSFEKLNNELASHPLNDLV
jgi:NDP-sugar pyrophosphorylase family protein